MIEKACNKYKHPESMPSQDSGEVEACFKVASELTNLMPRAETINLPYRTFTIRYLTMETNGFLLPSLSMIVL